MPQTWVLWVKRRIYAESGKRLKDCWKEQAEMTIFNDWYGGDAGAVLGELAAHFIPKWRVLPKGKHPDKE